MLGRWLHALLVLVLLAACGGGGGVEGDRGGASALAMFPVTINNTAPTVAVPAGSTRIIGAHGKSLADIWTNQIQITQGAEASSGAVTIADGSAVFTGPVGYQSNVQGASVGVIRRNPLSASYAFGTMYSGAYTNVPNAPSYGIIQGVYGQEAILGSSTVTAQYIGDAEAIYAGSAQRNSTRFSNGTAILDVDFNAARVDGVLRNFDATAASFDEIRIDNMTISGSRYEGGRVTTLDNGTSYDAFGSNAASVGAGVFLGPLNANGQPLETGGLIYARGDDGVLSGAFLGKVQ